ELMTEAEKVTAVWENRTTRKGFQTHGNLFEQGDVFAILEKLIRSNLDGYREGLRDKDAGIIQQFPKDYDLNGWHVKLVKAGYQKPHIHTRGWVSGVLYLKIPRKIKGNEGSIAFSLHGYDYRKEHDDIPVKEHMPQEGELVLFPSSLFHHTIPFESDEDRQCIAFDVLPK
ncbi:MAG: putative 2OG-Fe(II) oxygenase, partial [Pseudomonadota bacterium]